MKKRNRIIVPVALVLLTVFMALVIRYFNGESRGIVANSSGINSVKGDSIMLRTNTTSYFQFELPDNLQKKSSTEKDSGAIYGQYLYLDNTFGGTIQVAITLGHLQSQNFEELPFIKQRELSPERYALVLSAPEKRIYRSDSIGEYAVFWTRSSDYVSQVVSGGADDMPRIIDISEQAIRSWQWRD